MIRSFAVTAATLGALSAPAFAQSAPVNLVETAEQAGSFSTLLAAAEAAGLVETLTGEGPYTVFAPTDEAFAALPEGTVDTLLQPENQAQLADILLYHVVPGEVMSTDLTDDMNVETAMGAVATIDLDNGPMIEGANIVTPDVDASNGVIHVIDSVILPPAE